MKIVVIGTCQVVGMGEALRALLPDATVAAYHVRPETVGMNEIAQQLPACDLVINQIMRSHNVPLFTMDRLEQMGIPHLEMIPPIAFDGFHPDLHIIANGTKQLESPIEAYHSLILAASYLLGLAETQAINLFNRLVYQRLGYDAVFHASKQALIEEFKPWGYDVVIDQYWERWIEDGCFMHTPNHPRIDVLASFAKAAAVRAGLIDCDTPIPDKIPDLLAQQHAWAIYPELARGFGVAADMTFKRYKRGAMREEDRRLDLPAFAQLSYEIFRRTNIEILRSDSAIRDTANVIESVLRPMRSAMPLREPVHSSVK